MRPGRDFFYLVIGTALGIGLSPIAPGSLAALLGVGFHVFVALLLPASTELLALVLGLVLVVALNHWLTPWAVGYWMDKDPRHFVLDEIAGYLVVPILFRGGELWQVAVFGFFLFRTLDVIKVPPARQVDVSVQGSWGIVLDDLISGTYAALMLHGLFWLGVIQ